MQLAAIENSICIANYNHKQFGWIIKFCKYKFGAIRPYRQQLSCTLPLNFEDFVQIFCFHWQMKSRFYLSKFEIEACTDCWFERQFDFL